MCKEDNDFPSPSSSHFQQAVSSIVIIRILVLKWNFNRFVSSASWLMHLVESLQFVVTEEGCSVSLTQRPLHPPQVHRNLPRVRRISRQLRPCQLQRCHRVLLPRWHHRSLWYRLCDFLIWQNFVSLCTMSEFFHCWKCVLSRF